MPEGPGRVWGVAGDPLAGQAAGAGQLQGVGPNHQGRAAWAWGWPARGRPAPIAAADQREPRHRQRVCHAAGAAAGVWGILTPGTPPGRSDPGRIVRFSVGYGDATGRPTGAAEAITIPVRALRARIWVAFIPATAWLVGLDGF